jgi:Ty3 transposon capsid-like protein
VESNTFPGKLANNRRGLLDHLGLSELDPFTGVSFTNFRNPDSISDTSSTGNNSSTPTLTPPDMSNNQTREYVAELEEKIRRLELQIPTSPTPPAPTTSNLSRPKPSKPPSFAGERGESIDTWIKQVERYFRLSDIPEGDQVEWGASFLTRNAASWFEVENQRAETAGNDLTWTVFTRAIRKRFKPANAAENAREKLGRLKQTGSVTAYAHAFRIIMQDLPDMHENDALHYFKKGLKENVAIQVGLRNPLNVPEAEQMAETIDNILFEHRGYRESSRNYSTPNRKPGGPVPMEIDANVRRPLTDRERDQMRKEGTCFYCREGKHLARDCPKKGKKPAKLYNLETEPEITEVATEPGKEDSS